MAVSASLPDPTADAVSGCSPDFKEIRRQGLKRFMFSLPPYVGGMFIVVTGVNLGLVDLANGLALCLAAALALTGFYLALRSGFAARTKDPLLAFAQVAFALCIVSAGYVVLGGLHKTVLLWLSVIIAYDMRRLPHLQVLAAVCICGLTMLLAISARVLWHLNGQGLVDEVPTLIMLAAVLPVLVVVSLQARRVRLRQVQQKTQMAQTLAQLHQLSIRDGLTGLYCRRHMDEILADELRRWKRTGQPFCVAILDVDLFKRVNDQFGHATGDVVLQKLSELGRQVFPDRSDALARWGGEEFLLLQPQRNQAQAVAALLQMRDEVHSHDWGQYAEGLQITFSAGVCEFRADATLDQVLEWADAALYRAKAAGRDRILTHDEPPAKVQSTTTAVNRCCALVGSVVEQARAAPLTSAPPPPVVTPPSVHQARDQCERPPNIGRRLFNWAFGHDPRLRIHLYMCLLASGVYAAGIAGVLLYSLPEQLVSQQQALWLVAHNLVGALVPVTLVRMGMTAQFRDPSCVLMQLSWAGLGAGVAYGIMPLCGPTSLQILCLCVVFGFSSLTPKEARYVGMAYIAALLTIIGVRAWVEPHGFSPRIEVLEVAMAGIVLWMLTLQSSNFSQTRERVRQERQALLLATDQLSQIMRHDPLTGLINRQAMQTMLERECVRQERSSRQFCLALIDLDHFKRINDGHGHQVGDEALVGFAKAAQALLRETDVISRWGGEEFLVLLVDTEPGPNGVLAMNRLREHVARQRFCPEQPDLRVTFSAGLAMVEPGEQVAVVLARADQALYAAKAAGRNLCVLAEAGALSERTRVVPTQAQTIGL